MASVSWSAQGVRIGPGQIFEIPVPVDEGGSVLGFEWKADWEGRKRMDLVFSVSQDQKMLHEPEKATEQNGQIYVLAPGHCVVTWDNKHSWVNPKSLSYSLKLTPKAAVGRVQRKRVEVTKDELNQRLLDAVLAGELEATLNMLEKGANIDASDDKGNTVLHTCVIAGHTEVMKELLAKGGKMTATNKEGNSALHLAIVGGDVESAQLLMNAGAGTDLPDSAGNTPLHLAIVGGHVESAQLLIDAGAGTGLPDSAGNTPLHLAALLGLSTVATPLLALGASLTATNHCSQIPLVCAAEGGHSGLAKLLLEHSTGVPAIFLASCEGGQRSTAALTFASCQLHPGWELLGLQGCSCALQHGHASLAAWLLDTFLPSGVLVDLLGDQLVDMQPPEVDTLQAVISQCFQQLSLLPFAHREALLAVTSQSAVCLITQLLSSLQPLTAPQCESIRQGTTCLIHQLGGLYPAHLCSVLAASAASLATMASSGRLRAARYSPETIRRLAVLAQVCYLTSRLQVDAEDMVGEFQGGEDGAAASMGHPLWEQDQDKDQDTDQDRDRDRDDAGLNGPPSGSGIRIKIRMMLAISMPPPFWEQEEFLQRTGPALNTLLHADASLLKSELHFLRHMPQHLDSRSRFAWCCHEAGTQPVLLVSDTDEVPSVCRAMLETLQAATRTDDFVSWTSSGKLRSDV